MGIITTILLIFLIVIVLVLLIPFHIILELQKYGGSFNGIFELRWIKIRIFKKEFPEEEEKLEDEEEIFDAESPEIPKKETEAKEKTEDGEEKKKRKWGWDDLKEILKLAWASRNHFIRFIWDILKSINLDKFNLHLILGMDSTADTAIYVGYIWAGAALFNLYPPVHISAEPSFFNQRIDGEVYLDFKIRLVRPFLAILKLLTKKDVLKFLWELRRFRK